MVQAHPERHRRRHLNPRILGLFLIGSGCLSERYVRRGQIDTAPTPPATAPPPTHQRRYRQVPLQGGLVSFDATMREFLRSHHTALPLARPSSAITRVAVL